MADGIHTYPTGSPEHVTMGFDCWCHPAVSQVCPECDDDPVAKLACWRCEGEGWVRCESPEMYDGVHGLIIVHNDIEVSHGTA